MYGTSAPLLIQPREMRAVRRRRRTRLRSILTDLLPNEHTAYARLDDEARDRMRRVRRPLTQNGETINHLVALTRDALNDARRTASPPPPALPSPPPSASRAAPARPSLRTGDSPAKDAPDREGRSPALKRVSFAEPARPETPTRSRTPEGRVPRIARTPSPVRSARPYEMVPAVPGGPPVPLLLIEGEELTDALMDPAADVGDATVSFDESLAALPQHASRARAADDARWPDADDVSDDDAALASAVRCAGCQRGIVGALVHAMDAAWHARCFVCAACATPLEHVSFYAHDGRPYCHLDYHERFARRCFYCETPIIDERFVTIDDARLGQRSYHELHFFCAGCGDPFFEPRDAPSPGAEGALGAPEGGKPFFVHGAHPYCDAVRLAADPVPHAAAPAQVPGVPRRDRRRGGACAARRLAPRVLCVHAVPRAAARRRGVPRPRRRAVRPRVLRGVAAPGELGVGICTYYRKSRTRIGGACRAWSRRTCAFVASVYSGNSLSLPGTTCAWNGAEALHCRM